MRRAGCQKATTELSLWKFAVAVLSTLPNGHPSANIFSGRGWWGVWRGYDIAGVRGGEFALRLIPRQRAAPFYRRTRTHTHTHTDRIWFVPLNKIPKSPLRFVKYFTNLLRDRLFKVTSSCSVNRLIVPCNTWKKSPAILQDSIIIPCLFQLDAMHCGYGASLGGPKSVLNVTF